MLLRSLSSLLAVSLPLLLAAQTPSPVRIQLQPFASGLGQITDIAHCGDERLFVVQQNGNVRIVMPNGSVLPTPFLSISVNNGANEQGLLGLCFDPDYADNGYFYVYYTTGTGAGSSRVSRFSVDPIDPNEVLPGSETILYTRQQPQWNHNGGDLEFGPDGYLYVSFGDGGGSGDPQNAGQTLSNVLGTIIRIDVHGGTPFSIPADNPFVTSPGVLPEIWAYGLRNPWRFGFDALTGDVWIGDVGQNAWEEVDFWPAGDNSGPNFGWRCYEGNAPYNTSGCQPPSNYVFPVAVHQTSGSQWCSVIGGRVYRGDAFWRLYGRYIYTDYCLGRYFSLHPDGEGGWVNDQLTTSGISGATCIGENSSLELFVGNRNNGQVYRIVDICSMAQPTIAVNGNILTSSEANGYVWYFEGEVVPGAVTQVLEALNTGWYSVLTDHGTNCQLLSDSVFVSVTSVNGIQASNVKVHPVPTDGRLFIEGLKGEAFDVTLFDLNGRAVLRKDIRSQNGTVTLDLISLADGNYVLVVRDASGARLLDRQVGVQR